MIQVRVKFACFVTLLSVVCQSLGQAPPPSPGGGQGYFEVTYSGGAWSSTGEAGTVVGTYGPEQQENWGGASTGGGAGDPPVMVLGPGFASCSGRITATFTWNNEGNPANVPPPVAIVRQVSSASWFGDSGSCANGLGHPAIFGESGEMSTGVKWSIRENPGTSFTVTCDPSAEAFLEEGWLPGAIAGGVNVTYSARAFACRIRLVGVQNPVVDKRLLIGQKLRATVDLGGLPVTGATQFSWDVKGGAPFLSYTASIDAASYVGWSATSEPTGSINFHLARPQSTTISCSIQLGSPDMVLNLEESALAEAPVRFHEIQSIGQMTLLRNNGNQSYVVDPVNPDSFALWGATYPPNILWGMFYDLWVETTAPFAPPDYGNFAFVQLMENRSSYVDASGLHEHAPGWGLDSVYPHSPPGWVAAVSHQASGGSRWALFSDKPGFHNIEGATQLNQDADFRLYDFYVPPDNAAGTSAVVPLHLLTWRAKGTASWSGAQWEAVDTGSALGTMLSYPLHPIWTQVHN
ncbi:MAG: hypothetical protein CNCCGFBP_00408 [Fimbriimonadaceae bacterium]|nr:hypothetical protein [Fimbriimonadaceae bacterium]